MNKLLKLQTLGLIIGSYIFNSVQAEGFKPNGSIGFNQTFYGNSGNYKTSTSHPSMYFNYNLSPELSIDLEWDRAWNTYNYDGKRKQQNNSLSEPKATITYNAGNLSETQVNWSSSVSFENENDFSGSSTNYTLLSSEFNFSAYIPDSEFIKSTQFSISPMYIYGWETKGKSGHVNTGALGLLTNWQLPENFSLTLNAYLFKDWYSGSMAIQGENSKYSSANYLMISAWLNYTKAIYQINNKTSLDFNFTGGLDPYITSNRKGSWYPFLIDNEMSEWLGPTEMNGNYRSTYTFFLLPQIKLNYQLDKNLSLTAFTQVKYSNQVWGNTEKNWRLQPQIGFGAEYNF